MSTLSLPTEPTVLRIARAFARYIGFGDEESGTSATAGLKEPVSQMQRRPDIQSVAQPSLRLMPPSQSNVQLPGHKWRRHEQLRKYESPIPEDVRTGRHEAVRGLFAAKAGALDVATEHFAIAARCEEVDITAVPGFWNLTRGQMQAAVDAYESVGRYRDAAALDAHIATIFRPSLVGATSEPIVPVRTPHKAANV